MKLLTYLEPLNMLGVGTFPGFSNYQKKMAASSRKRDGAVDMIELEKEENEDEDNSDLYDELVESDGSDTDESIYGVHV